MQMCCMGFNQQNDLAHDCRGGHIIVTQSERQIMNTVGKDA